jgi:hypothetical protein
MLEMELTDTLAAGLPITDSAAGGGLAEDALLVEPIGRVLILTSYK